MSFKLSKPYNWLIFKLVNPLIEDALRKYAKGKLIDIGCGIKPYKQLAAPHIDEHVGLDYEGSLHTDEERDLIGTAYEIPSKDEEFDTVLCTYVLEHLEEPRSAVAEAGRILKKGGYAIYTVPLYWHLHEEPRDFYRYTKYGLKYLFESENFEVIETIAVSGFIANFAQSLAYYLWQFRYPKGGRINPFYWINQFSIYSVQWLGYKLNKFDKSERFTIEYLLVAKKK